MTLGRGLKAMGVALPFLVTASAGAAEKFKSYEAVYDIRLVQASSTGGPRAAIGTMEWRFAETCGGWETKTHTVMNLHFSNDAHYLNERFFESLESKNGRNYTFSVKTIKNDMVEENFKGKASLDRRGGVAHYELHPLFGQEDDAVRMVNISLPQGTLFPVAHSQGLVNSAQRGSALYNTVVLNGQSSVGPRRISIAIGPQASGTTIPTTPNVDSKLLDQPSWRLSTAFFNLFERRDTPTTEVFQQYHASGVTESFDQTFRDFKINVQLNRLRRLDPPKCGK